MDDPQHRFNAIRAVLTDVYLSRSIFCWINFFNNRNRFNNIVDIYNNNNPNHNNNNHNICYDNHFKNYLSIKKCQPNHYNDWIHLTSILDNGHYSLLKDKLNRFKECHCQGGMGQHIHLIVTQKDIIKSTKLINDVDTFRLLYRYYRDLYSDPTLLQKACKLGNIDIIHILLDQTAPVKLSTANCYAGAASRSNIHVLDYLYERGVPLFDQDNLNTVSVESISNLLIKSIYKSDSKEVMKWVSAHFPSISFNQTHNKSDPSLGSRVLDDRVRLGLASKPLGVGDRSNLNGHQSLKFLFEETIITLRYSHKEQLSLLDYLVNLNKIGPSTSNSDNEVFQGLIIAAMKSNNLEMIKKLLKLYQGYRIDLYICDIPGTVEYIMEMAGDRVDITPTSSIEIIGKKGDIERFDLIAGIMSKDNILTILNSASQYGQVNLIKHVNQLYKNSDCSCGYHPSLEMSTNIHPSVIDHCLEMGYHGWSSEKVALKLVEQGDVEGLNHLIKTRKKKEDRNTIIKYVCSLSPTDYQYHLKKFDRPDMITCITKLKGTYSLELS